MFCGSDAGGRGSAGECEEQRAVGNGRGAGGDKGRDAGAGVDQVKERGFPGAGCGGRGQQKGCGESAAKEGAIGRRWKEGWERAGG